VRIYTYADDAAPLLPRGTILRITGTFDNTPGNRNVADPRNWSGLGHRSIDNMMNQLGETQLLSDEEFRAEMVKRVKALGLKDGPLWPNRRVELLPLPGFTWGSNKLRAACDKLGWF